MNIKSKLKIGIYFIGLLAFSLFSCQRPILQDEIITLDPNNGVSNHNYQYDEGPVIQHEGFTGSKCVEVVENKAFGLAITVEDARPGEHFIAEVRRLNQKEGAAYLVAECDWGPYIKQSIPVEGMSEKDWDLIRLTVMVPEYLEKTSIKFYVWNPNQIPMLFDDLSVHRLLSDSLHQRSILLPDYDTISIFIDSTGTNKLEKVRQKAIQKGILETGDNDWVNGQLQAEGKNIDAKFRLKGDWIDHLVGKKWSFRIKTNKTNYWNRIHTFSVQRPESRSFLREWLYHQLLLGAGNLAPRYGFLYLNLNGESKGVYAWEEFFEKQLLEYHHRREGPILKFNEDGFWQTILRGGLNNPYDTLVPYYAASVIEPFKRTKTLSNPMLRAGFLHAQGLMAAYREASLPVSEIFNRKQMAVFFAVVDLTQAYHSLRWHNLRFYFNPITARLEPIGYDGFGEEAMPWPNPFIGYRQSKTRIETSSGEELLTSQFFSDTTFYRMYVEDLYRFTNPHWLDSVLTNLAPSLRFYQNIIQQEYPDYQTDLKGLFDRAAFLRNLLLPQETGSLIAYRLHSESPHQTIVVKNFHSVPVNIFAIGLSKNEPSQFIKNKLVYPTNTTGNSAWDSLTFTGEGNILFYRVPGIDSIFSTVIADYPPPLPAKPELNDFKEQAGLYSIIQNQVLFKTGLHQIRQNILIPEGYTVLIRAGTKLDFSESSAFISYSPVIIKGTARNPVLIYSSDSSARGFSVINASGTSVFSYTHFTHLNTFTESGRMLTGAVNIYESPISIDHCQFSYNQCEDAINIVRADFKISESSISHTLADGLDLDFSNGKILHCRFRDIGNDAMDFSGSRVSVDSCLVNHAGDKGLSAGEASFVVVK